MKLPEASQRANANIRRLICIRMFFHARFYYPVFFLFFLEHGLTLVDFGILNAIWAITIIVLEVPSGALADTIGRKKLIIFAAICMVAEMLALLLAPMDGSSAVFFLFAHNRVISGVAEAAVSGADEALVYDSMKVAGREEEWTAIMAKVQRYTSWAFVFAMMTGSAFYASEFINELLQIIGFDVRFEKDTLIKFPIQLTLLSSAIVLVASIGMTDGMVQERKNSIWETIHESMRKTKVVAVWFWKSPMPFAILLGSMVLDNVIRKFLTVGAAYWKIIDYPVATFGLIASAMSLMGVITPSLAKILVKKNSPAQNFFFLCTVLAIGLFGIVEFIPYWGILPAAMLYFTYQCMNYFASIYLNKEAESEKRATVLSFRSLSTNLSYGFVCILFALLFRRIEKENVDNGIKSTEMGGQDAQFTEGISYSQFIEGISWSPWYFLFTLALVIILYRIRFAKKIQTPQE